MPKPTPIAPEVRDAIIADIRNGLGRNHIARTRNVSTGTVSNIARSQALTFPNTHRTSNATHCARIDAALARVRKEQQLITQQSLALSHGRHRRARRIEKRITDTNRFHRPLHI